MTYYGAYGAVLCSTLPLPELSPRPASDPDLFVTVSSDRISDSEWEWTVPPPDVHQAWLAVAYGPAGYRLTFDGGGEFVVSGEGRRITTFPAAAASETTRHLLIDQVVPLALAHSGRFVLHASAFETSDGVVALMGPAGVGKSTLSASFGSHGTRLLADDALVVEPIGPAWLARPAYSGVRVWPDVLPAVPGGSEPPCVGPYTDKRRLGPGEGLVFASEPSPLSRIYLLDHDDTPGIEVMSLSPRDALMALVAQTFTLDASDTVRVIHQLDHALAMCRAVPVRRLRFPRELTALDAVRAAILSDRVS